MSETFVEDEEFQGIDFSEEELTIGDYENCDFSMVKTTKTAFREVKFKGCKLLGLHFEDCNEFLFSVSFEGYQLNLSSFYKRDLRNTEFKDCSIKEVDFTESDLAGSIFENLKDVFDE